MSKQDAVVPGLRVHLHQQGFVWGLRGVLNMTGRKLLFGALVLWWCVKFTFPAANPAGLANTKEHYYGRR